MIYEPNHVGKAQTGLVSQYADKPNVLGVVALEVAGLQPLEDAAFAMWSETVDTATGAQLDALGRIVGQARAGMDDPTFRVWIKARIAVNRSSGRPEDLIAIASALVPGVVIRFIEEPPAVFRLLLSGLDVASPTVLATVVAQARTAGVRGVLEVTNAAPAQTFTLDVGPGLDVGILADAYNA